MLSTDKATRIGRHKRNLLAGAAAICTLASVITVKPAFAIDKIYSPNVTKGELELEYSGSTTFDNHHDKDNLQSHETEFEYGLTDHIMLELNGSFEKQPDESVKLHAVGFGGRYQFFEQGEHWLDSGVLVTYNRATQSLQPDSVEVKLLLEKQWGQFLHRANIGIAQDVGNYSSGGPDRVFLWNSRYRYSVHFEPGFEIQSDFGKANEVQNFSQQEHYIGPAVYGQIIPHLKYEAVYYLGVSDAASRGSARVLLEYEMFF